MIIQGIFLSIERANEALDALRDSGFRNSYIQLGRNNFHIRRNFTNTDEGYRRSSFTFEPEEISRYPLASISPIVNPTGGFNGFTDSNYIVTVETDICDSGRAREIIERMDGRFEDADVNIGGITEDIRVLNKKLKDADI